MKKIITFLMVALGIGSVAFMYFKQDDLSQGSSKIVTVEEFAGDVQVVTDGKKKKTVFKSMRISQGDRLVTGGKSWVTLNIGSDKEVMVSENSSLSFAEVSDSNEDSITLLAVEGGKVWNNVKEKLNGNSKYEIITPTATMGVKGTKFYVNVSEDSSLLAVLDGTVAASTTVRSKGPGEKLAEEQVTLLVEKNRQLSIEKDLVAAKDELSKKIQPLNISSLDVATLRFILKDPAGIDPEIINDIGQFLDARAKETELIQSNKVQLRGKVFKPDGALNDEGGHIHILDSKNNWVYYGLVNGIGEFIVGELADGSYLLRSDPEQVNEYTRSKEIPFKIMNGQAEPATLDVPLNKIQFSAVIVDPKGLPAEKANLHISDSNGKWIYYAEIEKRSNVINIGGLTNGSYTIIAYPTPDSGFVQSNAQTVIIKNGKAPNVNLRLNTPQFSGSVLLADGKTPASGGHVHVRNQKGEWIQYVNLNPGGTFETGGLKDGDYWLMADSSEEPGYVSSNEIKIHLANGKVTPASPRLIFNK